MKTYFYLFLFLLISSTAKAQPYQSIFGKTSTAWIHTWANLPGVVIDSFYIEKDSIINGITYKQINAGPVDPMGFIREDTNLGKVWYRDYEVKASSPSDTTEKLAFRYDLNVGDTFNICNSNLNYNCPDSFYKVDSVRIKNGLKYIYFKARYPFAGEPYTLIEGNTSNMGVLLKSAGKTFMIRQYLLCVYKDGIKTSYENIAYQGRCHFPTSIIDNRLRSDKITIYPNPTDGVLSIQNTTHEKVSRIQIYDGMGKLVQNIEQQNIQTINLQSLSSGFYIARLFTDSKHVLQKTFVIHK